LTKLVTETYETTLKGRLEARVRVPDEEHYEKVCNARQDEEAYCASYAAEDHVSEERREAVVHTLEPDTAHRLRPNNSCTSGFSRLSARWRIDFCSSTVVAYGRKHLSPPRTAHCLVYALPLLPANQMRPPLR
jgi:hypothetical protein